MDQCSGQLLVDVECTGYFSGSSGMMLSQPPAIRLTLDLIRSMHLSALPDSANALTLKR